MRYARMAAFGFAFLGLFSPSAKAQSLPPVNLGATSFLDGAPPAGPGWYFNEYVQYYHADRFRDLNGATVPFPGPRLDVWTSLTQVIKLWDIELPGKCKPALDLLLPVANTNLSFAAPGPFPRDNGTGLGDLVIGPALQFDPIMNACGKPIFVHRLEAQFVVPTGKYSNNAEVNPGSGFFSFDPYWAGTLFLGPKAEVSFRAHYLWNAVNDSPSTLIPGALSTRAGEAFHMNFAASYELIEKKLRVGVNGYFLQQTTDSQINGNDTPGRERVLGIGPGMIVSFSEKAHLFFNYYFESDVRNRPEGDRLTLRFVYKF
jgi:hypothetical protein